MNLAALQHLIRAAQALAEDVPLLVLGSSSLLASFPEFGDPQGPLASTFDADLCLDPFNELTATMLDEALGEDRAYFRIHGYHADILRDSILDTLPLGWRERLVPVPATHAANALDPHDLAAVKLLVGRAKDLALVRELHAAAKLKPEIVRLRIDLLPVPVELMPRVLNSYRSIFEA
jgi:hypothetical protein